MASSQLALLVVIVIVIGLVLFIRSSAKNNSTKTSRIKRKKSLKNNSNNTAYHSVTIQSETATCQAVKNIDGKRYLSKDAPTIPLKECSFSECHCHYKHYDDRRRENNDRRIDYGITHDLYGAFGEKNRRLNKRGRRKND